MIHAIHPNPTNNGILRMDSPEIPPNLIEFLRGALVILWRGYQYARDLNGDIWEFAVQESELNQAGLSSIDVHWLLSRGLVECRKSLGRSRRSASDEIAAKRGAWFVLTEKGVRFVAESRSPSSSEGHVGKDSSVTNVREDSLTISKPTWDAQIRELRFAGAILKQFRFPAVNQETILMAFEEEGWPTRIDDPLSPHSDIEPKRRLHDTIKCLNRNHRREVIRFRGDGTGEGVLWSFLDDGSLSP